jgi:outer membrane protein
MNLLKVFLFGMLLMGGMAQAQEMPRESLHLSLQKAIVLASQENLQIFAANQRVRGAIANIAANRSALLPQVSGTLGGRRVTQDLRSAGIQLPGDPHVGPFNTFDMRGRITLEIFDPQAIERLQTAKATEKLSRVDFQKVREDILALVAMMFLEAKRADEAVALNETNLNKVQLQFMVIQSRLKQGTASQSELNKAQMDLSLAQYLFKAAQARAEQARLDLTSALQLPLDQPIIFEDDHQWASKELKEQEEGPDVDVARAQFKQSQANVTEVKAGFWPSFTASGDYGRSGESPSASSNTYSVGLAVNLPVWEGGLKQAQLEQAKAKLSEDEIFLQDAKSQNKAKIMEARNNLEQAKAFLLAKVHQLNYAQHEWVISNSRLKSGLGSRLEVDEASANKALALDDKNEAQALYWTARVNLAHAMGTVEKLFDI